MKSLTLENKWILITGASSGLGEQIAYQAAKQKANLILIARRGVQLKRVSDNCHHIGAQTVIHKSVDLAKLSEIDEFIDQLREKGIVPNVLINNAGFGYNASFLETEITRIEAMWRVNVLALIYLSQQIALMQAEIREGHIINIASLAGKVPSPHSAVYGATKAAMISFSNSLRIELKPLNISVSTVNLGPIHTAFFDAFDPENIYLKKVEGLALDAEKVARKIIRLIYKPKRELNLPLILHWGSRLSQIFPAVSEKIISQFNIKN